MTASELRLLTVNHTITQPSIFGRRDDKVSTLALDVTGVDMGHQTGPGQLQHA